jgi:membrane protease YdiL (CAAX protease family)
MSPENPFLKIRTRGLLLWMPAGTLASVVFLGVVSAILPLDEQLNINLLILAIYFWMALWIFRKARRNNVNFRRFFQRKVRLRIIPILGLVLALIGFSTGAILLLYFGLSHVSPKILAWVTRPDPSPSPNRMVRRTNLLLDCLSTIALAPLIEEVLFRGFLLNRWATKWGIRKAILPAAVVFGAMHIDGIIGASIFGVCMSLLYLKTRALWAPMTAHALNNLVATALGFLGKGRASPTDAITLYKSFPWFGIILFTLSTPFLAAFVYRNWPEKNQSPPYNPEPEADTTPPMCAGPDTIEANGPAVENREEPNPADTKEVGTKAQLDS